jgi:ATP-binding cassette subfamily B protein
MIQNAPLLILDENASSVDTRMERIVQNTMDKLTVGRTSFQYQYIFAMLK